MKLNHLNLVVTNVAAAVHFFETFFSFKCSEVKGDNAIAILRDEADFALVVMTSKEEVPAYPRAFHLGFMQDTREAVDDIYRKLQDGNVPLTQEPRSIRGGYGFYFHFDEILIEIGLAESGPEH